MIDLGIYGMRKQAFVEWVESSERLGLTAETYNAVLRAVLADQEPAGNWKGDGEGYGDVKTAVVLKALARLRFSKDDSWTFPDGKLQVSGGIAKAVSFLSENLSKTKEPFIGQDIWDTCQALLALKAFDTTAAAQPHAERIRDTWETLYRGARERGRVNQWTGPAFLSAMVEVVAAYFKEEPLPAALIQALSAEVELKDGKPTGWFPSALPGDAKMSLWNSSLVLRTMGSTTGFDPGLIELAATRLLDDFNSRDKQAWEAIQGQAPMYIARCLEGLYAARECVGLGLDTARRIANGVVKGNKLLEGFIKAGLSNAKANTAILEYFSALTAPALVGLLFEVAGALRREKESRGRPIDAPNGLSIVWLSDLHVADEPTEQIYPMSLVRGFFGGLKFVKGTPLTQGYQKENLDGILEKVRELKPDHILVTGDIANYARASQFQLVRDRFIALQAKLWEGKPGVLDPNRWTILPGNHDVSAKGTDGGANREHLELFFEYFKDVFPSSVPRAQVFPHERIIPKPNSRRVHLIGLDSTAPWPVWVVGINWQGQIDPGQFTRLTKALGAVDRRDLVIVALHHHPIVVPDMLSAIQNHFLSLDDDTGRQLIALCAQYASAILHGHFHAYSYWSSPVRQETTTLSIIGAPCGTMGDPGLQAEFLELREATLQAPGGPRRGLGVYSHLRDKAGWREPDYKGFIG